MAFISPKYLRAWASSLVFSFAPGCLAAQPVPPRDLPELVHQRVGPLISRGALVGVALGVIEGGEVSEFYLGGVRLKGELPGPDTLFEIGSITKVFTGTLLASQAEAGVVGLDDLLRAHLPDTVTVPTFSDKEITLAQLAEHTSGLTRLADNMRGPITNPYVGYTQEDMFAYLSQHKLRRAPGAAYEYSNYATGLLGVALGRSVGMPYEDFLRARCLAPLGMNDTTITLSPEQRTRMAQGYATLIDLRLFTAKVPQQPWDLGAFEAAGAIKSTLPDMLKFLAAAMGAESPLQSAFATAQQARFRVDAGVEVGLNWHINTDPSAGRKLIWHNGRTGGYSAFLGFHPDTQRGVVLLSNTGSDTVDPAAIGVLEGMAALPSP